MLIFFDLWIYNLLANEKNCSVIEKSIRDCINFSFDSHYENYLLESVIKLQLAEEIIFWSEYTFNKNSMFDQTRHSEIVDNTFQFILSLLKY